MISQRLIVLVLGAALVPTVSAHAFGQLALCGPITSKRAMLNAPLAMAIPGDSVGEAILVDGSLNALGIYMGILSLRILLSWFPQAQGVALLQPLFTASDVYLNLFRGVIPAIGGLDLSPLAAFFTLNLLSNSIASLGVPSQQTPVRLPQVDKLRHCPAADVC